MPMKDVVYPIMHDAKDAVIAETYTRQLYTLFGVGRSSTIVRMPILTISGPAMAQDMGICEGRNKERRRRGACYESDGRAPTFTGLHDAPLKVLSFLETPSLPHVYSLLPTTISG